MSRPVKKLAHYSRKRHFIQACILLTYLLLPIPLPFQGFEHGTLRFDFDAWQIHFFGITLVPGLFHIFFLGFVIPLFLLAVLSMMYSKVFCGWVCPQNIFYEMFEGVQNTLKKRYPWFRKTPRLQSLLDFSLALGWGLILAYTATSYFIGASPIFTTVIFVFITAFFTFDAHWLKHKFCANACPYAYLQKSFQDQHSLHVQWENRPGNRCGTCRACEVACYVDINVREDPFSIDCTMCGACIDACDRVFSRRPEPSLLRYSFTKEPPKTAWERFGVTTHLRGFTLTAFGLFCAFFAWTIYTRPIADFRVDYPISGAAHQLPYLTEGQVTNSYTVRVRNMTKNAQLYNLQLLDPDFAVVSDQGEQLSISVAPFEKDTLAFQVRYTGDPNELPSVLPLTFRLIQAKDGVALGTQELLFRRGDTLDK